MEIVNKLQSALLRFKNLHEPNCEPHKKFKINQPQNRPLKITPQNHPQKPPPKTSLQISFVNLIFLRVLQVTDDTEDTDKPDAIRHFTFWMCLKKKAIARRKHFIGFAFVESDRSLCLQTEEQLLDK